MHSTCVLSLAFTITTSICFSQVKLYEDFSAAQGVTLPQGWTSKVISGAPSDVWTFEDPYGFSLFPSPSGGKFATFPGFFLSDDAVPEEVALTSSPIDFSASSEVHLNFYEYFYIDPSAPGYIEVRLSDDGGETWNVVYQRFDGESPSIGISNDIDITGYVAGFTSVLVQFYVFSNSSVVWVIDDIRVTGGNVVHQDIRHTVPNFACNVAPYHFSAEVTTEHGVAEVWMKYRIDNGKLTQVRMNLEANNTYSIDIQPDQAVGSFAYQIIAMVNTENMNVSYHTGDFRIFEKAWFGFSASSAFNLDFEPDRSTSMYVDLNSSRTDAALLWQIASGYSSDAGAGSAFLNFYDAIGGDSAVMRFAPVFIEEDYHTLAFDVAYAFYESNFDTLIINIAAADRPDDWITVYRAVGPEISKTTSVTPPFFPDTDDWSQSFVNLNIYQGKCVLIEVKAISGNGNNLFIDNWRFVKLENFPMELHQNFPNPVVGNTTIRGRVPLLRSARLQFCDALSRTIVELIIEPHIENFERSLDLSSLKPGLYFYRLSAGGEYLTRKLVKQ